MSYFCQDKVFDSEAPRNTQHLFGLHTVWTDRRTQEKYLDIYDDSIQDQGMCDMLNCGDIKLPIINVL